MSENDAKKQDEMREWYDGGDYFGGGADVFEDFNSRFQKYRIRKVLEIYTPKPDERVLDLGCGWGTFTIALAPNCREAVGLDYSRKSIEACKKLAEKFPNKNISWVCADASQTGLPDASFDVVIAADLFEHLYPEISEKTLYETFRILKTGGKFLIWMPHRGHILEILKNHNIVLKKDPSHIDYKKMKWLEEKLLAAGFAIEKKYYAESHVPVLNIVEKTFLPIFPFLRRRIAILAIKK